MFFKYFAACDHVCTCILPHHLLKRYFSLQVVMEQNLEVANFPLVQISFHIFANIWYNHGNPRVNNVSHYNVSGYGGFGTGGAGLPGGKGGPGSNPGYPVGTGACGFFLGKYTII